MIDEAIDVYYFKICFALIMAYIKEVLKLEVDSWKMFRSV